MCGALLALSLPPFGWWPLAWLAFAGVAWVVPGSTWKARALLGAGFGGAQYLIGLWWVQEFSIPGLVGVVLASTAFVVVALVATPSRTRLHVALGMPAAFMVADWVRDRFPFGGLPLGGAALGQAAGPLAPVVRLGGSVLLTGVTVLAGVALSEAFHWFGENSARRGRVVTVRAAARPLLLLVLPAGVVLAALASPSGATGSPGSLRVALVQGGGQRGTRAINTDPQTVFDRHMAASASLAPPLDLVLWPEGVFQSDPSLAQSTDAAGISALAARLSSTVLVGVEKDVGRTRYVNDAVAWGPSGAVVGAYQKHHLVPFGEYVPGRALLSPFFNLAEVPLDGIPGQKPGLLKTPEAPLAVMISYEAFFDSEARGGVAAGGQVLAVPTNTASYRTSQVPTQELAAERLRAWETGRWVVQASPTGYSAVVSPGGRVVERTTLGRSGVLLATVPRETGTTAFVAVGDLPVLLLALIIVGAGWLTARRRAPDRVDAAPLVPA